MKSKTVAIVAIIILASISGTALAGDSRSAMRDRGPGMFGDADPQRMVARISRYLELDEAQHQELENIALAAEPGISALRQRAKDNRAAIAELDPADPGYSAELQNLATESGQIATEMTMALATLKADVHALLTEEQQQKLAEGKSRLKQHARDRRERRDTDAG